MGNCLSVHKNYSNNVKSNGLIEKCIKKDLVISKKQIKILLLGIGEAGKSTVLKQMRLIHKIPFSNEEKKIYKNLIQYNLNSNLYEICNYLKTNDILFSKNKKNLYKEIIDSFQNEITDNRSKANQNLDFFELFDILNKDIELIELLKKNNESWIYYIKNYNRIISKNFIPREDDILNIRLKTTGVNEYMFRIKGFEYLMIDVGGQRSERRKWIHCFENVTTILFLIAVNEYNKTLEEDPQKNKLEEATELFTSICESQFFNRKPMILFLNKIDLLEINLKHDFQKFLDFYPDYVHKFKENSFENVLIYMKNIFEIISIKSGHQIYTHYTHATDTKQIKHVMNSVNDIIISKNIATELL